MYKNVDICALILCLVKLLNSLSNSNSLLEFVVVVAILYSESHYLKTGIICPSPSQAEGWLNKHRSTNITHQINRLRGKSHMKDSDKTLVKVQYLRDI